MAPEEKDAALGAFIGLMKRIGDNFEEDWECCHGVSFTKLCRDCGAGPVDFETIRQWIAKEFND